MLGQCYILEDESGHLPNETYQYKIFACFELFFKVIKE